MTPSCILALFYGSIYQEGEHWFRATFLPASVKRRNFPTPLSPLLNCRRAPEISSKLRLATSSKGQNRIEKPVPQKKSVGRSPSPYPARASS